jgi:hypothetical protein
MRECDEGGEDDGVRVIGWREVLSRHLPSSQPLPSCLPKEFVPQFVPKHIAGALNTTELHRVPRRESERGKGEVTNVLCVG